MAQTFSGLHPYEQDIAKGTDCESHIEILQGVNESILCIPTFLFPRETAVEQGGSSSTDLSRDQLVLSWFYRPILSISGCQDARMTFPLHLDHWNVLARLPGDSFQWP